MKRRGCVEGKSALYRDVAVWPFHPPVPNGALRATGSIGHSTGLLEKAPHFSGRHGWPIGGKSGLAREADFSRSRHHAALSQGLALNPALASTSKRIRPLDRRFPSPHPQPRDSRLPPI